MIHMNKRFISFSAALLMGASVLIAGCTSPEAEPSSDTTESVISEETFEEGTHPVSSIPFIRDDIEEMNAYDAQMEEQGYHALKSTIYMGFTGDGETFEPIDTIDVEDNGITSTFVARIEESDFDGHAEYTVYALMTVNGQVVDFSFNGENSENGILTMTLMSNEDNIFTVSAKDLPSVVGENELRLSLFGYSGERDIYLNCQYSQLIFSSEEESAGNVVSVCPEEDISTSVYTDTEMISNSAYLVSPEEQIDFESDHYGYAKTITLPSPVLHYFIDNMSIEGTIGDRNGYMLFCVDGVLEPCWNGSYICGISVTEDILLKEIILETDFAPGEEHNICWYYLEMQGASEWPIYDYNRMTLEIQDPQ